MSQRPTISVMHDMDDDTYTLMATSYSSTQPAGPRLFRTPPWPQIQFQHTSRDSAERDATTLREYLAGLPEPKKGKSKARSQHYE